MILLQANRYDETKRGDEMFRDLFFDQGAELVGRMLAKGLFVAVASIDGDELERAFTLTQNGGASESWSRLPPEGVTPLGPGTLMVGGKGFGYASTSVGDLVIRDGRVHVVARFGFEEIDLSSPDPSEIPVIGGGVLSDFVPLPSP